MTDGLVGRSRELAELTAALVEEPARALLLRGEAGSGKTALLDAFALEAAKVAEATEASEPTKAAEATKASEATEAAEATKATGATEGRAGFRVLRATGVEAERALAYAGLHQLLHPLLTATEGMEPGHRATLGAVLGGLPERAPSVMALGVAVLDLLSLAAADRPLLLIVDDGQWFDVPSAQVCAFAARRIGDLPVRFVAAVREPEPSGFDDAGLDELAVPPLTPQDAAELLDRRFPALSPAARELTLRQADGNPLALVELPPGLAEPEPGQALAGDGHLPLPRRLERLFAGRIRALPAAERAELLRLALDGAGRRRSYGTQYIPRDVATARETGLIGTEAADTGRFAFRHPLVASAVVQLASPNELRAAHTALARLHEADVERRAVHLAAATVDPDPEVAAALEEAAGNAVRRGGATTAVQWLTRAAELHPRPRERARLLADAAYVAGQAGLLERAEILVAASDRAGGRVSSPDAVLTAAYVALYRHGDVGMHGTVAGVIRARHAEVDDVMLTRLVNLLLAISQFAADPAAWRITDELVDGLRDRLPAELLLRRDAWSDVVRRGAGVGERLRDAVAGADAAEPWDVMRLGVAAFYVDELAGFRPYLARMVEREQDAGAATSLMTILQLMMLDQITAGRWDEAIRTGERGLALTAEHGYELFGHQFRAFLGLVAAGRGETARAAAFQAAVDGWARPRRVGFLTQFAEDIGLLAALSAGEYETAWSYAVGITGPGEFAAYAQHAPRTVMDLVEAALHTGRDVSARTHAIAAERAGIAQVSPRLALLVAGALAMTGPSEEAFAAAVTHPAAAGFPFERARIRLAEGAWLRRHRRITEARAALADALAVFERLGARTWAERAAHELRSGLPGADHDRVASLTTQERTIAELAATGLSNKQIGARLFLSPRTVGAHLYRIFPKLGITSRAALRDSLSDAS